MSYDLSDTTLEIAPLSKICSEIHRAGDRVSETIERLASHGDRLAGDAPPMDKAASEPLRAPGILGEITYNLDRLHDLLNQLNHQADRNMVA